MAFRFAYALMPAVFLATALPAGAPALATQSVTPAASTGAVLDVTPLTAVLDARKRHTEFFSTSFNAEAGEVRFVGTELVVKDAKGTAPDELFLGVTLSCTSPSGRVTSAEAGRNVWPAGSDFTIPVGFTMQTDVAGTHKCRSDVMMCDPGNCASPTGKGRVAIVTQKMDPKNFSLLYVSTALPSWAQSTRVPLTGDRIVKPGKTYSMSGSFDVAEAPGPIRVGGILSMTNCIEKAYPDVCKGAGKTAIRGLATATVSLTLQQVATTPGATCATATATKGSGVGTTKISWQQHHAVLTIFVPDFTLSPAPGCGKTIKVTVAVKAGKGNAIALEAGSKAKITSVIYAIPGDVIPQGR
jgi:hypothetical protein